MPGESFYLGAEFGEDSPAEQFLGTGRPRARALAAAIRQKSAWSGSPGTLAFLIHPGQDITRDGSASTLSRFHGLFQPLAGRVLASRICIGPAWPTRWVFTGELNRLIPELTRRMVEKILPATSKIGRRCSAPARNR